MGQVVPIAVKRTVVRYRAPARAVRAVPHSHGPGRRPRDREHLLASEIEKLIEAARKGRWGHRDATIILLLFSHGLRIDEGLSVKWSQLDLDEGIFHVRRSKGSFSGDHRLRGVEIRALRRLQREGRKAGEFIFTSERGGPMTSRGFQLLLERIAVRAGLGDLNIHPHMFRHSCGYYLGDRGADLRLIQSYLGHRDIRHTVRYVQLSPRRFQGLWDD